MRKQFVGYAIKVSILTLVLLSIIPSKIFAAEKYQSDISIDYAYLRKVSEYDNGTIHLFLKNQSEKKVVIEKVYINSIPVINLPNEKFIWLQILPDSMSPGGVTDIMVKLSHPINSLINMEVEMSSGERVRWIFQPVNPSIRLTYVGFSDELDKIYIYLENSGQEIVTMDKVYLNTENITSLANIPWEKITPNEKKCIVVSLRTPLKQGQYIGIKIETKEAVVAESVIRVFTHFPIGSWDGDYRQELFFDPFPLFLSYPGDRNVTKGVTSKKIYRIMCDPNYIDLDKKQTLGRMSKDLLSEAQLCRGQDAVHPTFTNIDCVKMKHSYPIYGETADIISVNPYQIVHSKLNPESDGYFTELGKKACEPRLLYTLPEAFRNGDSRYPTPEEERLVVYYEITRGSKGILYYLANGNGGYRSNPELETEIGRINSELQLLKRFLIIGDPVSLAESNEPMVEANTILVGQEAIVLILINRDHKSHFKEGVKPFNYVPKNNFSVSVHVPNWIDIKDVYEVGGEFERIKFTIQGEDVVIPIDKLDLTRQIVLTTNINDYNYDGDKDGIPDREETREWCSKLKGFK